MGPGDQVEELEDRPLRPALEIRQHDAGMIPDATAVDREHAHALSHAPSQRQRPRLSLKLCPCAPWRPLSC